MASPTALVWFKRDLRVRDHAALVEAVHFENALGLVVIEPQWLESPECDPRHVGFMLDCVAALQRDLAAHGLPLLVRTGDMPQVLASLRREFSFTHLFSHEETGPGWSYTRDLAVADWCRSQGVPWTELRQTGVVRRLRSRTGWAGRWAQRMNAPEAPAAGGFRAATGLQACAVPTLRGLGLPALGAPLPSGGERAAWATLDGFFAGRGRNYRRAMSSPLTATDGCSRLSAHRSHARSQAGLRLARLRQPAALALPLHAKTRRRTGHRVAQRSTQRRWAACGRRRARRRD